MDLSTKFFLKLEWASHANNRPFLLILLFGTGFHDKVVHEKELVESFHGCSVKRLCDYRDDIVDFHTRCDPTVWKAFLKSILAVDRIFILSRSCSFLISSDSLLPYLNFSLPVARSIRFLPLSCSLSISIMRWINHRTMLCWSPFRFALLFLEFLP